MTSNANLSFVLIFIFLVEVFILTRHIFRVQATEWTNSGLVSLAVGRKRSTKTPPCNASPPPLKWLELNLANECFDLNQSNSVAITCEGFFFFILLPWSKREMFSESVQY